MSSEELKEVINNFNIMINNQVAYEFIDDISDASNVLWDYLVKGTKLPFNKKEFIIGFICLDYIDNPFINDRPISLDKAIEKFNEDNIFGVNVLDNYIEKYFQDAILINRYNNLNLNYSEDLELDDDLVCDRVFEVLNNSSFFNSLEKEKIIKHLIKECQEDIEEAKKDYQFDESEYEYEFDSDYLNNLEYYYENIDEVDKDDKVFILNLVNHYFKIFIEEDFKIDRLEYMMSSLIEVYNKVPEREKIEKLYDQIIDKNEEFDYSSAIESFLEYFNDDIDAYDRFVNDRGYAIESLIKYYKSALGEDVNIDEGNKQVFFINELARDILYNLIGDINNNDKNTAILETYFNKGFGISEYYEPYWKIYNISFEDMASIQKICLISDYYNKYSDSINKDNLVFNNIKMINENNKEKLLEEFDNNFEFRQSLIESFVDDVFTDNYNMQLCSDVNTLTKINPFIIMEMSSNKAYQKKLG